MFSLIILIALGMPRSVDYNISRFIQRAYPTGIKVKATSDSATYVQLFTLNPIDPEFPAYGNEIWILQALKPGAQKDTLYTGTIYLYCKEELPDNSGYFSNMFGTVIDSIDFTVSDRGEKMIYFTDTIPEDAVLYAVDKIGVLKPSIPLATTATERGDSAVKCLIKGPNKINAGYEGDNQIHIMYTLKAVDSLNRTVPDYNWLPFDSTKIRVYIVPEDDPDSTAYLATFWSSGQSVKIPLISGQGYFTVYDSIPEVIRIVAEAIDSITPGVLISPDTFTIDVRPSDEYTVLIPISNAFYGTVNRNHYLLSGAIGDNGPDASNNSTQVRHTLKDVFSPNTAVISPSDWSTLIGGITGFTITDDNPDTALLLHTEVQGTPELYPLFPVWTLGTKQEGEATILAGFSPFSAVVGDTILLTLIATDGNDSLDSGYNGYGYVEVSGDAAVLDSSSQMVDHFVKITNGVGYALITDTLQEDIDINIADAEKGWLYGYLGSRSIFENQVKVSFGPAGLTATKWDIDVKEGKKAVSGFREMVTVKAVDDSANIDSTFMDTAIVKLSGNAVPDSIDIPMVKGIGTFFVNDDSAEVVIITATGAGLSQGEDTLYFSTGNEAIFLAAGFSKSALVNDTVYFSLYALNSNVQIDTTYNGVAVVQVIDTTGDTLSSYGIGCNLDSIPVVNGVGLGYLSDKEIEDINVVCSDRDNKLYSASDTIHISFYGNVMLTISGPDTVGTPDTLTFSLRDVNDSIIDYSSYQWGDTMYVGVNDSLAPGSVLLSDSVLAFQNGTAVCTMTDTSQMGGKIDVSIDIQDKDHFSYTNPIGSVYLTSILERSISRINRYFFNLVGKNPVSGDIKIKYGIPSNRKVQIIFKIFDIVGREKRKIGIKAGYGKYMLNIPTKDFAQGIYFIRMEAEDYQHTEKIIVIK